MQQRESPQVQWIKDFWHAWSANSDSVQKFASMGAAINPVKLTLTGIPGMGNQAAAPAGMARQRVASAFAARD